MSEAGIRIDLHGQTREFPLGEHPRDQARAVSRALLDAPEVIRRLHHRASAIVVIGGKNRARHQPNPYAGVLLQALGSPAEDLRGSIVLAGVTPSDHLTSLPDTVLAEVRQICLEAPGQRPAAAEIRTSATNTNAPQQTTDKDADA